MASPTIPNEEIVVPSNKPSRKVAVIGAGAAGLVTARELLREGHKVVVFERHDRIGGTWIYNHNVESDPLGLDPSRSIIHTSLYDSLRTNLPREAMGFRDYPFIAKDGRQRDPRRFPCHSEVLFYLEDFTCHFQLTELIRLGTEVLHVGLGEEKRWVVRYRRRGQSQTDVSEEVYDAVVVCNGHYTEPRIAAIPGIDTWPGKQIHSHNYRVPEPFRDQVVVLIGGSVSASDISRDIAGVVKEVHVASRSCTNSTPTKQLGYDNIWLHSMIVSAHEDGTIVFQDGSSAIADVILYCTGFRYHFPFLETNNIVTVDDNRVGPLYHHIFPPQLAPWISFIGLPWKVLPFPLYEVQSKWVARVLSERIQLPSQEEMISNVEAFYVKLEAANVPKHYTHCLSDFKLEYIDYLAAECGFPASEEWRKQMCTATLKNMIDRPETYRDEWDDQHLILQAQDDFLQYF